MTDNLKSRLFKTKKRRKPERPVTPLDPFHAVKRCGDGRSQVGEIADLLKAMLADASVLCNRYGLADYTRDCETVEKRLKTEGIGFATRSLPQLSAGLLSMLEGYDPSYPAFKLQRGTNYPRFLKGLFYVIMQDRASVEAVYAIDCIHQISNAFKKLQGEYKVEQLVKQYNEFVSTDLELAEVPDSVLQDSKTRQVLELARFYARDFCESIDLDNGDFIPRPGPGATNTPVDKHMRYSPHVFYTQHQRSFPYLDWFFVQSWDFDQDLVGRFTSYKQRKIKRRPRARFKFVPKVAGKARGICIEENESQWLQQAVAKGLRSAVGRTYLKKQICFTDQSVNATLALASSDTRDDATIDMSEASDRVCRWLVLYLFQDNRRLCDALDDLSTREIEPPAECDKHPVLRTLKYAPMGSGLCFPVMSLVHYFLVRAIVHRTSNTDIRNDLYVYGDDIILPSEHTASVYDILPKFGMKLNVTKSFYRSHFRESCGIHAYKGNNITPVFFRKTQKSGKTSNLLSSLATESLLIKKGWRLTAKCLRMQVNDCAYPGFRGAYVNETSQTVGWKRSASFFGSGRLNLDQYRNRWNGDLQCREYRLPIIKEVDRQPCTLSSEYEGYLRWFVQTTEESICFHDSSKQFKIAWKWVAESAAGAAS